LVVFCRRRGSRCVFSICCRAVTRKCTTFPAASVSASVSPLCRRSSAAKAPRPAVESMCPVMIARPGAPGRGPDTHHPAVEMSEGGSRVPAAEMPMGTTRIGEPSSWIDVGTDRAYAAGCRGIAGRLELRFAVPAEALSADDRKDCEPDVFPASVAGGLVEYLRPMTESDEAGPTAGAPGAAAIVDGKYFPSVCAASLLAAEVDNSVIAAETITRMPATSRQRQKVRLCHD